MNNIVSSKKNCTKKDITFLFLEMKRLYAERKVKEALDLAEKILLIKTSSTKVIGAILELFIDEKEINKAKYVADLLKGTNKLNGYENFLLGRTAQLLGNYIEAINYGELALKDKNLLGDRLAENYNMLGALYKLLCNQKKGAEYYFLASECAKNICIKQVAYSNYLFSLNYLSLLPQNMLWEAKKYNKIFLDIKKYHHNTPATKDKIRIGYLSADLRHHVVAEFVQAFFRSYDKECFEVYVYANCQLDSFGMEMSNLVDSWRIICDMDSSEAAFIIKQDKIDILVELGGHTANNGLPILAFKPAPVQICGIGYFASTGLDTVDYFLGDKYLDVNETALDFSEKILRLEHSHWCYRPIDLINTGAALSGCPYVGDPCMTPPAPFQKNGYITFGCFGKLEKFNLTMLQTWSDILRRMPSAKLLLKGKGYFNDDQLSKLSEMLVAADISVDRLILEKASDNYMQSYANVDIALDTFPYVGGGITCDALYMGVPVITLYGDMHHSRFGYSILSNIGLSELACSSIDEYIEKAVELANNKEKLKFLHKNIRRMMEMSYLMDDGKYMAELEAMYRIIWYKYLGKTEQISSEIYVKKGLEYIQNKKYSLGKWYIKEAIKLNNDNAVELHNILAIIAKEEEDSYEAYTEIMETCRLLETEDNKGVNSFRYSLLNNKAHFEKNVYRLDDAIDSYQQAINFAEGIKCKTIAYSNYLYGLVCSNADSNDILTAHKKYNIFTEPLRNKHKKNFSKNSKHKKIRIGYMSPDFRQHVMFSFYYSLLACYDKENFEIICYSLGNKRDGFTRHLHELVDGWRDTCDLPMEDLANLIQQDEIDILVDLAGHSAGSALPVFALRVAPVQISGLGWMETTGLKETDYFITDYYVDGSQNTYLTETPLFLTSQFCYTARNDVLIPENAPCKKNGYITFGVFNNIYKFNDYMIGLWKSILEQVPKSILLFKAQVWMSLGLQQEFLFKLHNMGIDVDRVIFEPATNTYMNRYLDIDIALDTYPYTGGGTTCDALYMGVPVISLYGNRRSSRFGYSILNNIGLGELAVNTADDYIDRTVALANDLETLDILHRNIRSMLVKSPVMNSQKYIQEIQDYYLLLVKEKRIKY